MLLPEPDKTYFLCFLKLSNTTTPVWLVNQLNKKLVDKSNGRKRFAMIGGICVVVRCV